MPGASQAKKRIPQRSKPNPMRDWELKQLWEQNGRDFKGY